MCALTPVQSYVAMYGLMIGGVDISSVGNFSPLVIFLFIVALFSGLIVMVNISCITMALKFRPYSNSLV